MHLQSCPLLGNTLKTELSLTRPSGENNSLAAPDTRLLTLKQIQIAIESAVRKLYPDCKEKFPVSKYNDKLFFKYNDKKRNLDIVKNHIMLRVGGGWITLDKFLEKHPPSKVYGRRNIDIYNL